MFRRTDAAHLRDGAIGRDPRKRDPGKENARVVAINAIPVIITIVSHHRQHFPPLTLSTIIGADIFIIVTVTKPLTTTMPLSSTMHS